MTGIVSGRHSRAAAAFMTIALLAPLLAAIPLTPNPPAVAATGPAEFTFEGGGWGHGVGLSQYGAYAMAKVGGMDRDQILSHYYPGTSPATLGSDIGAARPLWVNLEREATAATIRHASISSAPVPVTATSPASGRSVPVGGAVAIEVTGSAPDGTPTCRTTIDGLAEEGPCSLDLAWDGTEDSPTSRVVIESVRRSIDTNGGAPCTLLDWNAVPTAIRPCTYSRGVLHIRPDDNTASFHIVLEIDVEDYLLGISEMPYYWSLPSAGPNGMAALEAQAIAARSYAVHRQLDRGDPSERPSCWCNLYDTAIDQRYVGWGHSGLGQQGWLDAVRTTAGIVRTHPGEKKGGKLIPIEAFYGSSSYGRTEPAGHIFLQNAPYLQAVDDPWSIEPAVANPEGRWSKRFTGDDLARILGWSSERTVASVEVASCSPSGTIAELKLVDASGKGEVRPARSLRSLLGLRSPQITSVGAPAPDHPPCGGLGSLPGLGIGTVLIDDDGSGDSTGNGDGVAACGESVEVRVELTNGFTARLSGVEATLTSKDQGVVVAHNASSPYPRLAAGAAATNDDDWDLVLSPTLPDGHTAVLSLAVRTGQGGPWVFDVPIPVTCGAPSSAPAPAPATGIFSIADVVVDDGPTGDSLGNGDGAAQCGETIELYVTLAAQTSSRSIAATLATTDPYLTLLHNTDSPYPDIDASGTARNRNDWDLEVAGVVPPGHVAALSLRVTAADGIGETHDLTLPLDCVPPPGSSPVALARLVVDDGVRGDSVGNGDRRAQCGETIELYAELVAIDPAAAAGVSARLATTDGFATILYNTDSPYPTLTAAQGTENRNDWDIALADVVPNGHVIAFTLDVTTSAGPVTLQLELPVECAGAAPAAPVAIETLTVDDGVRGDSVGNNDRRAQCGETVELYVTLANRGGLSLDGLVATLAISGSGASIRYNTTSRYPKIATGSVAENLDDWDVVLDGSIADGTVMPLVLTVSAPDGSRWDLPLALPVACP